MNDAPTGTGAGEKRRNLRFDKASDLFLNIPEISEDVTATPGDQDTVTFINTLLASPTPEEAISFCAYVLPRRFSVWWGHECLRQDETLLDSADLQMLELAAQWVANPDEENRYSALDAAMESAAKTPGVWVAFGAGWSGGSMVGPDMPPVPPPPHLTARAVNAGVLSLLARVDVNQREEQLDRFARMAIKLSEDS
ncbi:MAG: hypothetical protein ACJAQW_001922 [Paracoccaceae bacterium]|jgi:hypothetical protein